MSDRDKMENGTESENWTRRLFLCKHLSDVTFILPSNVCRTHNFFEDKSNPGQTLGWQGSTNVSASTDVEFPVHKFVLCKQSDVFRAMFHGPLADNVTSVIIVDIEARIMREVLRFIYYNTAVLNGDNVFRCVYAATKYNITGLLEACATFITDNIRTDNVCCIHEHALFFDLPLLLNTCLNFMLEHASEVIITEGFLELSLEAVKELLKSDDMMAEEVEIFRACIRWAENKCRMKNVEICPENVRKFLNDLIYQIRFPNMCKNDFFEIVLPSKILTNEEENEILDSLDTPELSPLDRFIIRERTGRMVTVCMYDFRELLCLSSNTYGCNLCIGCDRNPDTTGVTIRLKAISGVFVPSVIQIYKIRPDRQKTLLEGYKIDIDSNTILFPDAIEIKTHIHLEFQTCDIYSYSNPHGGLVNIPKGLMILTNKLHRRHIEVNLKGVPCYISEVPKGLTSVSFLK